MYVEYDGIFLDMAEIQFIRREGVWDDSHTHLLYVRWKVGVLALYSPNGYPVATATTKIRKASVTETLNASAGTAVGPWGWTGVVNAIGQPFVKFKEWLIGTDAEPTEINLRRNVFPANAQPDGVVGNRPFGPILTDISLRNRLLSPRKKLRIVGYDWNGREVVLLESPRGTYVCDADGGPKPIACDVVSGMDMSFGVYYEIETTVLPCDDDSDRLVLSHTWQMSHQHDENQYLTRVIDGEIVLNASMIHTFGVNADLLRNQFFHPIPIGCFRTVPHVTPSVDGLHYTYRIEDHDQTITFDSGDSGCTNIEIAEKVAYYQPWRTRSQD